MTFDEAVQLRDKLGLNGVEFGRLFNSNKNYFSNFKRDGVPQNIAIILKLSSLLIDNDVKKDQIIKIIDNQVKSLDR